MLRKEVVLHILLTVLLGVNVSAVLVPSARGALFCSPQCRADSAIDSGNLSHIVTEFVLSLGRSYNGIHGRPANYINPAVTKGSEQFQRIAYWGDNTAKKLKIYVQSWDSSSQGLPKPSGRPWLVTSDLLFMDKITVEKINQINADNESAQWFVSGRFTPGLSSVGAVYHFGEYAFSWAVFLIKNKDRWYVGDVKEESG